MTPGDNLEFYDGSAFAQRLASNETLHDAIVDILRNRPQAGRTIVFSFRYFEMTHKEKLYRIIYSRRRNTISLMDIYEWPKENRLFEDRIQLLLSECKASGKE